MSFKPFLLKSRRPTTIIVVNPTAFPVTTVRG